MTESEHLLLCEDIREELHQYQLGEDNEVCFNEALYIVTHFGLSVPYAVQKVVLEHTKKGGAK